MEPRARDSWRSPERNLPPRHAPFRVRFFCSDQGEAVWEKPAELAEKSHTVGGVPTFDRPEEWVCYLDETSGEEYWFNLTTGETHWGAT